MLNKNIRSLFLPFLLFIGFGFLYIHNLSRSVYGGDVGDFVTAASVGGVAHPPGYPLFVLIGFLLIHGLPFFTPAFAMGLVSAFSGAFGVVIMYGIIKRLTNSNLTALVTSLVLGLSYLFWFYAEIAEVFALHSLFVLLSFYLAILFDQTKKNRYLLLFSFILGIGAITHQTIVLFVPSFLLILFPNIVKLKNKRVIYGLCWFLFASAFLVYLYVFIASSHHPPVNWDNVHDLRSFVRLLLRQDYGTLQAGLFAKPTFMQRYIVLRTYLFSILTQLTIPVVLVSLVGMVALWQKSKRYVFAFLLAFFLSGPVFVAYAGFPLEGSFYFGIYERFFTMSTIPIVILFGVGLYTLAKLFARFFSRPLYFTAFHLVFLLVPLQLFFFNVQKTDLSQVWIGDTLGIDFLSPLPSHAIFLIGGDTALFNAWYVHYALHLRPDVTVINLSAISLDPAIKKEEQRVQKEFPKLHDNELVAQTLKEIAKEHPVFSYEQLQAPGITKINWVPVGLVYQLLPDSFSQTESSFSDTLRQNLSKIHLPESEEKNYKNLTIADMPEIYAKSLWSIGNYYLHTYKNPDTALVYYKKALQVDPLYDDAYITTGLVYLTSKNDCSKAEETLQKSLTLIPYNEFPYFLLYTTYTECYHDSVKAKAIIANFDKEFGVDFFKELERNLSLLHQ